MTSAQQPGETAPSPDRHEGTFGAVALAAYQPDESMFARQLKSIQDQTHKDFVCIISVDGDYAAVEAMVRRACGDDTRFHVLGYESRLGFHHNFERALQAVPEAAQWVALSDQDDFWYPEKLEALIPHLDQSALVTGQARVVTPEASTAGRKSEGGTVTGRRNVDAADFIANNQVTGSLCVFRRELLEVALPFPSIAAPSQYHDHWIGLCALAFGGVSIQDVVVQDYIQHSGNVVGEARQSLPGSIRNTLRFVKRYEGSTTPRSIGRIIYKTGLGWRTLMARTLLERSGPSVESACPGLIDALGTYAQPRALRLLRSLVGGMLRKNVSPIRAMEIFLGLAWPRKLRRAAL